MSRSPTRRGLLRGLVARPCSGLRAAPPPPRPPRRRPRPRCPHFYDGVLWARASPVGRATTAATPRAVPDCRLERESGQPSQPLGAHGSLMGYDADGRVVSTCDSLSTVTTYVYDASGRRLGRKSRRPARPEAPSRLRDTAPATSVACGPCAEDRPPGRGAPGQDSRRRRASSSNPCRASAKSGRSARAARQCCSASSNAPAAGSTPPAGAAPGSRATPPPRWRSVALRVLPPNAASIPPRRPNPPSPRGSPPPGTAVRRRRDRSPGPLGTTARASSRRPSRHRQPAIRANSLRVIESAGCDRSRLRRKYSSASATLPQLL